MQMRDTLERDEVERDTVRRDTVRRGTVQRDRYRRPRQEAQLALIDDPAAAWHLDEETRRTGRRGLELARHALREAGRRAAA